MTANLRNTISPGRTLGVYRIDGVLGAGGMGEVYRARDTRLERDVAIKILPSTFASSPDGLTRFDREARVLASLNHPNIGAIYAIEETDDIRALVLELVDGETLAERLARGPMSVAATLAAAHQIADALEAAHARGIVHRDLKPANIKIRPDGGVKVLDFGLAKLVDAATDAEAATIGSTRQGTMLGTPAYMSPEQASGAAVDKRADVWAFGCVVFEMLSGTAAFGGQNVSDTIVNVLGGTPKWDALPPVARPLAGVLRKCLDRDVKSRLRDVCDAALLLDAAAGTPPAGVGPAEGPRTWMWHAAAAALTGIVVGGAAVAFFQTMRSRPVSANVERFEIAAGAEPFSARSYGENVAISPDGSTIVYTTLRGAVPRLMVRHLDQLEATPLAGSEGGFAPFFSPDGRSIGFAAFTQLKRVAASGGPSSTICAVDAYFSSAAWGPDDTIVFAQGSLGLFRVAASGGVPQRIAAPNPAAQEAAFGSPLILPGGAVLYTAVLSDGTPRILSRRTGASDAAVVIEGGFGPHYLSSGHLIYAVADQLMAVRFNPSTLQVVGSPVAIPERILTKAGDAVTEVAAADNGTIAYISGQPSQGRGRLAWVSRQGARISYVVDQVLLQPRFPRISPDGRRLVVAVGPGGKGQLWEYDLRDAAQPLKLTFEEHNLFPIWSPDGKQILFYRRGKSEQLLIVPADGSAPQAQLFMSRDGVLPFDWTADGRFVLVETAQPAKVWLLSAADRTMHQWLQTPFTEVAGRLSKDGQWMAYASNQTGASEVWVRPFPGPGAPVRVSADGGSKPLWSPDGNEIFFENGPKFLAARVTSRVPEFRTEPARVLFTSEFVRDDTDPHIRYVDVAPDGRLLMVESAEPGGSATIVVAQHWNEELKRLLP